MLFHQIGGGADDQLQAAPVFGEGAQLLVGAQGGADHGDQPAVGQFGLGAIIVDVVFVDDGQFRGVARLAGAQDDPAFRQPQLVADITDQVEAGLIGFHHHVHQGDSDVGMLAQLLARLRAVVGVQQAQGPSENPQVVQDEVGDAMHLGVVVDDQ